MVSITVLVTPDDEEVSVDGVYVLRRTVEIVVTTSAAEPLVVIVVFGNSAIISTTAATTAAEIDWFAVNVKNETDLGSIVEPAD